MRLPASLAFVALLALPAVAADTPIVYPDAPRGTVTDAYFGTTVSDPYRWLENLDAPATVAWVNAENALTRRYLDAIPARPAIAAAYRRLRNYPYTSAPFREGNRWFFTHNSGLQTQSAWFVRPSEFGPARLFFDPNTLSKDGTIQLAGSAFSSDGSLFAYATSTDGTDWQSIRVKAVATGKDMPDRIDWSKYSDVSWLGDRGFFYSGYDRPTASNTTFATLGTQKLWFHRLGTPQSADHLVATAVPDEFVSAEVTRDNRYVLFERSKINGNAIAWKNAADPGDTFRPVFALDPDVQYDLLGNDGPRLYLRTNLHAANFRVISVDLTDPHHTVRTVVAETGDKLEDARLVRDRIVLAYLHDAHSLLRIASLHGGRARDIPLPGVGTASLAPAKRENSAAYYTYESYAYPPVVVRYDVTSGAQQQTVHTKLDFDAAAFVTEQIFATSKDGTRIPVFVTHRRDMPYDGTTPAIIYGYGGFDISWTPGSGRRTRCGFPWAVPTPLSRYAVAASTARPGTTPVDSLRSSTCLTISSRAHNC
jgi:prolyl oligopeptidase